MGPLRGLHSSSWTAAADVWRLTSFTQAPVTFFFSLSGRKVCLSETPGNKYKDLIRTSKVVEHLTKPQGNEWMNENHLYFPSRCPLLPSTTVPSHAALLNYTDRPDGLIRGSINCPFSLPTWQWLIITAPKTVLLWLLSHQKMMTFSTKGYNFLLEPE